MLCQECQKEQATVHMIQYINGQSKEMHLCEACAQKQGFSMTEEITASFTGFNIANLLSGLVSDASKEGSVATSPVEGLRCTQCGQSFGRFQREGFFGCSGCYSSFTKQIQPLLRRVHGSTEHRGKIPLRSGQVMQVKRQIDDLRKQMQQAISEERFENAAELRDTIRDLESKQEVQ